MIISTRILTKQFDKEDTQLAGLGIDVDKKANFVYAPIAFNMADVKYPIQQDLEMEDTMHKVTVIRFYSGEDIVIEMPFDHFVELYTKYDAEREDQINKMMGEKNAVEIR